MMTTTKSGTVRLPGWLPVPLGALALALLPMCAGAQETGGTEAAAAVAEQPVSESTESKEAPEGELRRKKRLIG